MVVSCDRCESIKHILYHKHQTKYIILDFYINAIGFK
jgi:hypothetical protein